MELANYVVRPYQPGDTPAVVALQETYAQAYPGASIVPGAVYCGPGFAGGQNVFCAWLPSGRLAGYAPLYVVPVPETAPDAPRVLWAEIKVDPGLADAQPLRDLLFEYITLRARSVAAGSPGRPCHLAFQYLPGEVPSLQYVQAKGATYAESVFRMTRDLLQPLPEVPRPAGVTVCLWRMPSEVEQLRYVEAYNEAFPDAPLALADWRHFMASPQWAAGGAIAAFADNSVGGTQASPGTADDTCEPGPRLPVGSVTVYWDEAENRRTGVAAGYTEYVFTRPGWRGQGIARHLIATALDYLRQHALCEARLEVRAHNEAALDLYRALGYVVAQEARLYVLHCNMGV